MSRHGAGAGELGDVRFGDVLRGMLAADEVRGSEMELSGLVTADDVGVPLPPAALLPSDVTVRTVSTSKMISNAIEPSRTRRRRQYTGGGCGPTG
jgi:hypothetical protein